MPAACDHGVMAPFTTIAISCCRTGCGALATALLLAGIPVPAAGQATSPTAVPAPAVAPAPGSAAIREADCRFLADNFRTLEIALSTVDFAGTRTAGTRTASTRTASTRAASTRANVLVDLHANVARLHRRRGCPSRQLVAAFNAATAAAAAAAPETAPYPAPVQARTGGQAARASTLPITDGALLPVPPLPKPPVPPAAGPHRATAAPRTSDQHADRRPKMDDLIVTARVPVRIEPDDGATILGVLQEGSLVPVISPTPENGWLRMDVGQGRAGFVPAAAVTTRAAALETLRRRVNSAAGEGDPEAQFQAGNIAVRTDLDKAIDWWRKAADAGHPGALYNLGVAHVDGSIQPTDSARAVALWREAAQKGHPKAQQALAKAERLLRRTRGPVPPQAAPATATAPVAPTAATAPAAGQDPEPAPPSTGAGATVPQPTPRDPDAVMPAALPTPAALSTRGAATDAASRSPDAAAVAPGPPAPTGNAADGPGSVPAAIPAAGGALGSDGAPLPPPPPGVLPNE